jgi:hypothetical protein
MTSIDEGAFLETKIKEGVKWLNESDGLIDKNAAMLCK